MTKQEFLAASVLYNLKCVVKDMGVLTLQEMGKYHMSIGHILISDLSLITPIVHPIKDLIVPIHHNGETFIPLFELAKLTFSDYSKEDFSYEHHENNTIMLIITPDQSILGYDLNTFSFFAAIQGKACSPVHQLTLFQKLLEWHFDIANLIKTNQATSINSFLNKIY